MSENDNIKNRHDIDQPESCGTETKTSDPKKHSIKSKWLRITLKTLMWIIVVILMIPVLLYVPPVQTFVKNVACSVVKKSTGLDVKIDLFRLKFPLDVSLQGVSVVEATGDTMVYAREVIADVKLLPLVDLDVKINKLKLLDGYYRMVSPDSSMVMKIKAGELNVDGKSSANIATSLIDLNEARLRDGDVSLYMNVWKKKPTPPDSASTPFVIRANRLKLENFRFAMSMLPTIDTLMLQSNSLELERGVIDLRQNDVSVRSLAVVDGSLTYLTPTPEYVKTHPAPIDSVSTPGSPMTIRGDSISLDRFKAVYGVKGAKPQPGFDANYLSFTDIGVGLKGFYNKASELRIPITRLMAKERSGLAVTSGSGMVAIDSVGLDIRDLNVTTLHSKIFANANVPFALMALNPKAKTEVLAEGEISPLDIASFMPTLKTYTSKLPSTRPAKVQLKAAGSLSSMNVSSLRLNVPQVFDLVAKGSVDNPLDIKKMKGSLEFEASLTGPKTVNTFLGNTSYDIPQLQLTGSATADRQTYSADFSLLSDAGDMVGSGLVSLTAESYDADIEIIGFEAGRFLPDMGLSTVSASISVHGGGFNPSQPGAYTSADVAIAQAVYKGHDYKNIDLHAELLDGVYSLKLNSPDPLLLVDLDASGTVAPDDYTFDVRARIANADLHALGLTETVCSGNGNIYLKGSASPERWLYDATLKVDNFDWNLTDGYIHLPQGLTADVQAVENHVRVSVDCDDTNINFASNSGLKHVVDCFMAAMPIVDKQIAERHLDVEALQSTLPNFRLNASLSGSGLLHQLLTTDGMSVDTVYATLSNDSLIKADVGALGLNTGALRIDTANFTLDQRGSLLDYRAHIGNAPGTLDEFAEVNLSGYVGGNRVSLFLNQKNIQGETGYRLGLTGAVTDSIISVHFSPLKATIAYRPWSLNADNHLEYTLSTSRIDANLLANSAESSILLMTETNDKGNEELHVNLQNLKVEDFLQMSVFAPPIKAMVSADMRVGLRGKALVANGSLNVNNFYYNRTRVGDFEMALKAGMGQKGNAGGVASLKVNGRPALSFHGALMKDSVGGFSPRGVKLELTQFPLNVANPFLGPDVAKLEGYLNGTMAMSGTFIDPLLNGSIECDSVKVFIPMIGTSLRFDSTPLTVTNNVIDFNNFEIFGANVNPLIIKGQVNARKLSDINFDMGIEGKNVQVVGNDKRARSPIYGNLFVNLDASVRGPMKHFDVNANLSILSATDVSYQLQSEAQTLVEQSSNGEVVSFVQFSDTTQQAKTDSIATAMNMRIIASLNIEPGTRATVLLSPDNASNRLEITPSGTLRYIQDYMGDMRLNGQLNIGEGFVRYTLPVMGEKKFVFEPGGYARWNGDVMNPQLSINAYDDVKVNVVQTSGNSRLVNFKVGLMLTNTLSSPGVNFDLSTADDVATQNELQSMSADQRATAAMNMLITGQYTGGDTKTASSNFGNMANTALYGFLTSKLNSWAANHIRGVDLSFGVDQYDKTMDGKSSTTTSYSYQVSKSLFNNKFKIVVGGNYSTDASADENFAQNLLSDISFEYMLKQNNWLSMYLKLFRHNGFESIVEGEVTETGVGFVMRRRMSNLRQLFRFGRRKKAETEEAVKVDAETEAHTDSTMIIDQKR